MFNSKCLKYQVGPTGPQGIKGNTGNIGPTGPQGSSPDLSSLAKKTYLCENGTTNSILGTSNSSSLTDIFNKMPLMSQFAFFVNTYSSAGKQIQSEIVSTFGVSDIFGEVTIDRYHANYRIVFSDYCSPLKFERYYSLTNNIGWSQWKKILYTTDSADPYKIGPTGPQGVQGAIGPTGPQGPAGSTSYTANSATYDSSGYHIHNTFEQLLGACYNGGGQMAAQGIFIGNSRSATNFIYTNENYLSFRFYDPKASDKIGYISINDFMDKRGWSLDGTTLYITT